MLLSSAAVETDDLTASSAAECSCLSAWGHAAAVQLSAACVCVPSDELIPTIPLTGSPTLTEKGGEGEGDRITDAFLNMGFETNVL